MRERTIIIGLALGLGVVVFWVLLSVGGIMMWEYFIAWQEPHELSPAKIPLEFRTITGQELPKKADGLRAIFKGSLDPEIFVRFETDAEGIEHIKRSFMIAGSTSGRIVAGQPMQMWSLMFSSVPRMQEKLGICLFDQKSIESGLLIESPGLKHRFYSVLIDEQRGTVYIYAILL